MKKTGAFQVTISVSNMKKVDVIIDNIDLNVIENKASSVRYNLTDGLYMLSSTVCFEYMTY